MVCLMKHNVYFLNHRDIDALNHRLVKKLPVLHTILRHVLFISQQWCRMITKNERVSCSTNTRLYTLNEVWTWK